VAIHCLLLFLEYKTQEEEPEMEFYWIRKLFSDKMATPPTTPATPFIEDINSS
jgi:hypothetical protein